MANNKLLAIVTVMMMLGTHAKSEPTLDDLIVIEGLIGAADWRALYDYVQENPRLVVGSSALATELRSFTNDVDAGQLSIFDASPAATTAPDADGLASIY